MRKRWPLVLAGAVAMACITVVLVALLTPREAFQFLEGHRPVWVWQTKSGTVRFYSWKQDWRKVAARAKRELPKYGFKQRGDEGLIYYRIGRHANIWIMQDVTPASSSMLMKSAPGWISVGYSTDELGLWERIKALFGL